MSDYYSERSNKQTLRIVIGNVTFFVDSDHPDDVKVSTIAEADIDSARILSLADVGREIHDFVTSLNTAS